MKKSGKKITPDSSTNPDDVTATVSSHRELFRKLLGTSELLREANTYKKISALYDKHKGDLSKILENLHNQKISGSKLASELEFTLGIGSLTGDNLILTKKLQELRSIGELNQVSDLVVFDEKRWKSILQNIVDNESTQPITKTSRKQTALYLESYARTMINRVEDTFPMEVIRDRIAKKKDPDSTALAQFLSRAPDFKFGTKPIDRYLKEQPKAFAAFQDPNKVSARLKTMQRIYEITPRYSEMSVLLDVGMDSAHKITTTGRKTFIEEQSKRFGTVRAGEIFDKAAHVATTVQGLLVGNFIDQKALPRAIRADQTLEQPLSRDHHHHNDRIDVPDWESLFGPIVLCACEDCQSALSPAAYLVDLLHFLSQRKLARSGLIKEAASFLFEKRPDIAYIELTCANTHTELPYVDLVNEILENEVSRIIDWTKPVTPAIQAMLQTTHTAEELAAEPEHVNPGAYRELLERPYPWSLPFDLWTETLRPYLDLLGVKRYELMESLFPTPFPAALRDVAIAAEFLEIVESERIIFNGAAAFQPWQYWGYGTSHPTWVADQNPVPTFLHNSGLNFENTLTLIHAHFINPDRSLKIVMDSTCDLSKATIAWPDEATLDRVHRFVRLWRKLGWTMNELDMAIRSLATGGISDTFIVQLSHIQRIRIKIDIPLPEIFSWWAPLDTFRDLEDSFSYYETLFQNRGVKGDSTDFALNAAKTELQTLGALNNPILLPRILSATGLSADEFALLTEGSVASSLLNLANAEISNNQLSLLNLSVLWRFASFSRALGISVREVLALKAITGVDPFEVSHTEKTLRFIEIVEKVNNLGLPIPFLDYLFRHNDWGMSATEITDEVVVKILENLRTDLQKARAEMPEEPDFDPTGGLAVQRMENMVYQCLSNSIKLETLVIQMLLKNNLQIPSIAGQPGINAFLNPTFTNETGTISAFLFPDLFILLRKLRKIAFFIDNQKISSREFDWLSHYGKGNGWIDLDTLPLAPLSSGVALFEGWERFTDICQLNGVLSSGEAALSELFLTVNAGATTQNQILDLFHDRFGWGREDLDFVAGPLGLNLVFPGDFRTGLALLRLKPVFDMLRRLAVPASKVKRWVTSLVTQSDAEALIQSIKAHFDNSQWPAVGRIARDVIRERQRSSLVAALLFPGEGTVSKWQSTDELFSHFLIDVEMGSCQLTSRIQQAISSVQTFVQRCLLRLENAAIPSILQREDWTNIWNWLSNYRVWEANRKVFLYPENWILPELRDDKSPFFVELENELLQNEINTEAVETAYLHYLQKLDDVAHLQILGLYEEKPSTPPLLRSPWHDLVDPFGYNPRDNPPQWVRELQILLNDAGASPILEVTGIFDVPTAHAVFSFQINNGLPSTFFNDVDSLTWEALKGHSSNIETIHVIGRTRGNPKNYYARKRIGGGLDYWTPWEQVDLTIDAEQVLPIVWHDRPYLIWPIFTKTIGLENSGGKEGKEIEVWAVQLAWSEYRSGKWQTLKSSSSHPDALVKVTPPDIESFDEGQINHLFRTKFSDDALFVGFRSDEINSTKNSWFLISGCNREPIYDSSKGAEGPVDSGNIKLADSAKKYSPLGMSFVRSNKKDLYLPMAIKSDIFGALVLGSTHGVPSILPSHQDSDFSSQLRPFFVIDDKRTFFVTPISSIFFYPSFSFTYNKYKFEPHYHPYVCNFIARLNRGGVGALLQRSAQVGLVNDYFKSEYVPTEIYVDKYYYPVDEVDFSLTGAYASYNWEMFFHAPFMIAAMLMGNQRFKEAQQWLHYIFDPMDTSNFPAPQRYWRTKPFFNAAKPARIQELLQWLATPDSELDPPKLKEKENLRRQIQIWLKDPFNPHFIARLRTAAYQKTVVMKYVQNLIAWGDQLFSRDTREDMNQATQLYILVAEILGPRPEKIRSPVKATVQTFHSLAIAGLDDLSNALVKAEDALVGTVSATGSISGSPLPLTTLFFCIPPNEMLLNLWDIVADRLFKVRHCMNIDGVVRELPLYEPPIDPAILVRATAAGLDLGAVLNDLAAPQPHFRFKVLCDTTMAFVSDLKQLGHDLMAVLEKRDAEALALLHAGHETNLLNDMTEIKDKHIKEIQANLDSLYKLRELVFHRRDYYRDRQFISEWEVAGLIAAGSALLLDGTAALVNLFGSKAYLTPKTYSTTGAIGGPPGGGVVKLETFPKNVDAGQSADSAASALRTFAGILAQGGRMSDTMGTYWRRKQDWDFQGDSAEKEIHEIDKKILAAQMQLDIVKRERINHGKQIDRSREINVYMKEKFTNKKLYEWMISQLSALYFQGYQLAYGHARKCELSFRNELGLKDSNYVQFGHWETLYKGLLAGERLYHDLKRMQAAYQDRYTREFELTKQISMFIVDPLALIKLKQSGLCFIDLPEALFDMDYPGHYMRRIKSVSLTIPCVSGPYINICATLTLMGSSVRQTKESLSGRWKRNPVTDPRFIDLKGGTEAIGTSTGQNDSGLFELNFHDERYLPFEMAGAISSWKLELSSLAQIDYQTISDIILQIGYTSRSAEGDSKEHARAELQAELNALALADKRSGRAIMFSLRHRFPSEWSIFVSKPDPITGNHIQKLAITADLFPFYLSDKNIKIQGVHLFALAVNSTVSLPAFDIFLTPSGKVPNSDDDKIKLNPDPTFNRTLHGHKSWGAGKEQLLGEWIFKILSGDFVPLDKKLEDVIIILEYKS